MEDTTVPILTTQILIPETRRRRVNRLCYGICLALFLSGLTTVPLAASKNYTGFFLVPIAALAGFWIGYSLAS